MNKDMILRIGLCSTDTAFTVINILKSLFVLSPNSNTNVEYSYIPGDGADPVTETGILNGICSSASSIKFIINNNTEVSTDPGDSIELPMIGFPKTIRVIGFDNTIKVIIHVPEPTRSANGSGIAVPGQMPVLIKQS